MKIAIDLGTTYSVVYVLGRGVVLREPSALAVNRESGAVIAYGEKARGMLGRTPRTIEVVRPLREGVIANFDGAREMLRHYVQVAGEGRWIKRYEVVLCVPHGATPVEMEALRREAFAAGAHRADLVREPFAAALGAGLPIHEPQGNLVVDIGGGTTEATAISLNNVVHCESLRMAGNTMDQAVEEYFRARHHFAIGETTAESVKIRHGSVIEDGPDYDFEVKGLDVHSGRPAAIRVSSVEIREALEPTVRNIVEAMRRCIEHLPPELAGDILTEGAALVGGGALLRGWVQRLEDEVRLRVRIDEDPPMSVTRGLIRILEDRDRHLDLIANSEYQPALAG
ncbi:MAG: rod shape-determining protein, partial [Candidatus Binatia bacterium]